MVMTRGIHTVVDGEVAADEIGAHGGVFAGQGLGLVDYVGLVFAVVDADDAGVAGVGDYCSGFCGCCWWWGGYGVGFVEGVGPVAALAEAWVLLVELCLVWW